MRLGFLSGCFCLATFSILVKPATGQLRPYWEEVPELPAHQYHCAYFDESGMLWAGGAGFLISWDGNVVQTFPVADTTEISFILKSDSFPLRAVSTKGQVYQLTNDSLTHQFELDGHRKLLSVKQDGNGDLWLATRGGNIIHHDYRTDEIRTYKVSGRLFDLAIDRRGAVYCSAGQSILKYSAASGHFEPVQWPPLPTGLMVGALHFDEESRPLALTFSNGLWRLENGVWKLLVAKHELGRKPSLHTLRNGRCILSDDTHLWYGRGENLQGLMEDAVAKVLTEDSQGRVWKQMSNGRWFTWLPAFSLRIGEFNSDNEHGPKEASFLHTDDFLGRWPDLDVLCSIEAMNLVWLGSSTGLWEWDGEAERFFLRTDLPLKPVPLMRATDEGLLVSFEQAGLWRVSTAKSQIISGTSDQTVSHLYPGPSSYGLMEDGTLFTLAGNQIKKLGQFESASKLLLPQSDTLWLLEKSKLTRLVGDESTAFRVPALSGISAAYQGAPTQGDSLMLRMGGAALDINPAWLEPRIPPAIWITEFTVNEERFDTLTMLSHEQNRLSFRFRVDDPFPDEDFTFAYRLLGYDQQWAHRLEPESQVFSQLAPGLYTLEYRACLGDDCGQINSLSIEIHKPWWDEIWARTGVLILVLVSFYGVYHWRGRQHRKVQRRLAQKVLERTVQLKEKNIALEESVAYAMTLQKALLPEPRKLSKAFPESFVWYHPRDGLSGDFWWFRSLRDGTHALAVADCTGHGIPGAMLSMMASSLLGSHVGADQAPDPGKVLDGLRYSIIADLETEVGGRRARDGMDLILLVADPVQSTVKVAMANNPLYLIRKGADQSTSPDPRLVRRTEQQIGKTLFEIRANKQSVGYLDHPEPFNTAKLVVRPGDVLYLFTDGYADQFGGPFKKKLKVKALRTVLLEIHELPLPEQKLALKESFLAWQGDEPQVDDVCVVAVKIPAQWGDEVPKL